MIGSHHKQARRWLERRGCSWADRAPAIRRPGPFVATSDRYRQAGADYRFRQGASKRAASTRCSFVATSTSRVHAGADTCVRARAGIRRSRRRRGCLCPDRSSLATAGATSALSRMEPPADGCRRLPQVVHLSSDESGHRVHAQATGATAPECLLAERTSDSASAFAAPTASHQSSAEAEL